MQIRRSASGIEILAPAKINLFFEVLDRRDDGFHEIETLMVPIGLYDTLILEDDPSGMVTLATCWAAGSTKPLNAAAQGARQATVELGNLPLGDDNHAVRAIRLLAQRAGIGRGAKLRLVKRIPAESGLGGGSSDAAAALVAANRAWSLDWTTAQLAVVAAELGSDVPFFLAHGQAICRGRGERIEPVAGLGMLHLVVVRPPEGLSTAAVYRACQPGDPPQQAGPVVEALRAGKLSALGPVAHNRLLAPARQMSPWIGRALDRLTAEDCPAVGLTGSGSGCFALCRSAAHARRVAVRVRSCSSGMGRVWAVCSV